MSQFSTVWSSSRGTLRRTAAKSERPELRTIAVRCERTFSGMSSQGSAERPFETTLIDLRRVHPIVI